MSGPSDFSQCIFGNHLAFYLTAGGFATAEEQLSLGYPLTKNPTRPGGNVVEMLDGSRVVQFNNFSIAGPENMQRWIWQFEVQADLEQQVNLFKKIRAIGRPVYMVDFDVELEAWVAYNQMGTIRVNRKRASDVFTASVFNPSLYPDKLLVDGVEWTEVAGAPDPFNTEWQWVETAEGGTINLGYFNFTGGEVVEFRYYPAYKIHMQNAPISYQTFGDLRYQYTLVEVGVIQDSITQGA